jgi:pSer/pThr/pTyr-binding forkhead associated (FHA) protein
LLVHLGDPERVLQVVMAGPDGCMIGRSRQNNICILQDEMVSRKHAKISKGAYHYMIHDVGSINGTFVNQVSLHGLLDSCL